MSKNIFDNYWDNFYQQNQSDNLHAQTGSENSTSSQTSGQADTAPKTTNGLSGTVITPKKIRMIGYHDPVTPENSPTLKHMIKMGLVDDSDNLHAQQDDNGKPAYSQSLSDTVNRGAAKTGQQLAYGMKLNADEHLSRSQNPVLDITKKGIDTFGKSGAEHQDESAGLLLQSIFEKMRHGAVSDTHTREIDSTANGKDKLGMVTDGLKNEFVTKPQTAFWSIGSMASEGIRHAAPQGSTDSTSYDYAESKRSGFQQKENDYERQSMSLKDIWDNENAENTVNNAS